MSSAASVRPTARRDGIDEPTAIDRRPAVIHAFGAPEMPVPRLLAAMLERGHAIQSAATGRPGEKATLLLGPGIALDGMALGVLLGAWRTAPGARVLVMSLLGAHPDARERRLKGLWQIEELARGSGMPVLTLRLAPIVGPNSPLWLHLRSRPRLPRGGRQVIQPVFEGDVVETMDRALRGDAPWEGWYEVAGEAAMSLAELAELASAAGPPMPRGAGEWEPPLDEMKEHRLSEPVQWREHFRMTPTAIQDLAGSWVV
jgi:hypothetical protein